MSSPRVEVVLRTSCIVLVAPSSNELTVAHRASRSLWRSRSRRWIPWFRPPAECVPATVTVFGGYICAAPLESSADGVRAPARCRATPPCAKFIALLNPDTGLPGSGTPSRTRSSQNPSAFLLLTRSSALPRAQSLPFTDPQRDAGAAGPLIRLELRSRLPPPAWHASPVPPRGYGRLRLGVASAMRGGGIGACSTGVPRTALPAPGRASTSPPRSGSCICPEGRRRGARPFPGWPGASVQPSPCSVRDSE